MKKVKPRSIGSGVAKTKAEAEEAALQAVMDDIRKRGLDPLEAKITKTHLPNGGTSFTVEIMGESTRGMGS